MSKSASTSLSTSNSLLNITHAILVILIMVRLSSSLCSFSYHGIYDNLRHLWNIIPLLASL
jgi:hypothetical protein